MKLRKLSARIEIFDEAASKREPPTEFRISLAGLNTTLNGPYVFDAKAAKSVLDAFEEHGAVIPLDYDHRMLDPGSAPGGGIAAGWFRPEVRKGELWAVKVLWTPRAANALRELEYRYISPAFYVDDEGRMVRLINVALTNLPATHGLEALVAASQSHPEALASGGIETMTEDEKIELTMCKAMGIPDVEKYRAFKAATGPVLDAKSAKLPAPQPEGEEAIVCKAMGITDLAAYRAFKAEHGPVRMAPRDEDAPGDAAGVA